MKEFWAGMGVSHNWDNIGCIVYTVMAATIYVLGILFVLLCKEFLALRIIALTCLLVISALVGFCICLCQDIT